MTKFKFKDGRSREIHKLYDKYDKFSDLVFDVNKLDNYIWNEEIITSADFLIDSRLQHNIQFRKLINHAVIATFWNTLLALEKFNNSER